MKSRPKKRSGGSGHSLNDHMLIRLTGPEKETFREAASMAGQALSVWVRDRLRQSAKKELEETGRGVRFL